MYKIYFVQSPDYYNSVYSDFFKGYIDELRISKGIARWTSNFTPPSAPYSANPIQETDPTVPANLKDGVSWSEVANIPADIADGDQVGITAEQDPKVASTTANSIPKWDGATGKLVDSSSIVEDGSGNMGIGKTNPAFKLDVNGTINATEIFKNGVPFNGSSLWTDVGSYIQANNAANVVVTDSGNVGIGTTNPGAKLQISAPDDAISSALSIRQSVQLPRGYDLLLDQTVNGNLYLNYIDNGEHPGTNIMTWQPNGNVGIGTTNPTAALHLGKVYSGYVELILDAPPATNSTISFKEGNQQRAGFIHFRSDGGVFYDNYLMIYTDTRAMQKGGIRFDVGRDSWTEPVMMINYDLRVGIGITSPSYKLHVIGDIACTGNFVSASDLRLKENITPLTNAIDKVSALRGIYFNLKGESPSNREVGVIAQEVEAVLPEAVTQDAEGYKSVDYSRLTPLLIEAVKELEAQNEELRARIEALESR